MAESMINNETIMRAFTIQSGSDMDDLIVPGVYKCVSSTIAASLVNTPVTNSGFELTVYPLAESLTSGNRIQMIVYSAHVVIRCKTSSGWGSWYDIRGTSVDAKIETLATGITLYRSGYIRVLNLNCDFSSSPIVTLASGDYPQASSYAAVRYKDSSGNFYPANLAITTTGKVTLARYTPGTSTSSTVTSGSVVGSISWVVA